MRTTSLDSPIAPALGGTEGGEQADPGKIKALLLKPVWPNLPKRGCLILQSSESAPGTPVTKASA